MVAIKGMEEMPKCCHWDCPLCNEDGGACMLGAYETKTDTKKERASDCPLVEIITCKECKHWMNDLTPRVPDTKDYHFCPMMDCNTAEDFYCADGERRE